MLLIIKRFLKERGNGFFACDTSNSAIHELEYNKPELAFFDFERTIL